MTSAVCVVQARMGSSRLPGKVLADVAGRPMLGLVLDRLAALPFEVVVATSTAPGDDAVADVARSRGVPVVRGPEDDVLARFMLALDAHGADAVVRITGDCPLADAGIVLDALDLHRRTTADYTSNILPRTFPKGLDVEVADAHALRRAATTARLAVEREHVMPHLYRHPERHRLANLRSGMCLGDERWTVDVPQDLDSVRDAIDAVGDALADWREILEAIGERAGAGPRLRPADEQTCSDTARQLGTPWAVTFHGRHDGAPLGDVALGVVAASAVVDVRPLDGSHGAARHLVSALVAHAHEQVQYDTVVVLPAAAAAWRTLFVEAGFDDTSTADDEQKVMLRVRAS